MSEVGDEGGRRAPPTSRVVWLVAPPRLWQRDPKSGANEIQLHQSRVDHSIQIFSDLVDQQSTRALIEMPDPRSGERHRVVPPGRVITSIAMPGQRIHAVTTRSGRRSTPRKGPGPDRSRVLTHNAVKLPLDRPPRR